MELATHRRPSALDAVLALGIGVLATAEATVLEPGFAPFIAAVLIPLLLVRQVIPELAVTGAAAVLATLSSQGDTPLGAAVALVLTVATTAALRPPQRSSPLLGALLGASAVAVTLTSAAQDVLFSSVLYGGAWATGALLHRRAEELVAAEGSRIEAVREERVRIARELHDVVAHSLSVVTLQTQVVRRRLPSDRTEDVRDLEAVEATARSAMAELRTLFGVLRSSSGPAELTPQPALADLDGLAAGLAGLGLTVDLDRGGVALASGMEVTVFRIVQESLTNVRRHSFASQVSVRVAVDGDSLQVEVLDPGPSRQPQGAAGHGLVGMRERVAVYGGTLTAGPDGQGFAVRARVPL